MTVLRAQIEAVAQATLSVPSDVFGGLMQRADVSKKVPRVENVTIAISTTGATQYDPQKADFYMSVTRSSHGDGVAHMGGRMATLAFQRAVKKELSSTNRPGKNHPFIDPDRVYAADYIMFDNDKMVTGTGIGLDNHAVGALMRAWSTQVNKSIEASPEMSAKLYSEPHTPST